ncbi:hypothetical protein ACG0Z6_04110 [Roseateles sp. BYS180W]|uniref:Uncharacterized protein n=1 Tax=Roseateles rivi TaxID=3299028 RepID=A0ABW7FSX1_9BURK
MFDLAVWKFVAIATLALALAWVGRALLVSLSLQDIAPGSAWVWLLDADVVELPAPSGARVLGYRSEPADGNRRALTAVRYWVGDASCDCEGLRQHLLARGYRRVQADEFLRGEETVEIRHNPPHVDVTKYAAP